MFYRGRLACYTEVRDRCRHYGVSLHGDLATRVHDSNMTDRSTPGTEQAYMQQVNTKVAARLREMAQPSPYWVSSRTLRRLTWHSSTHPENGRRKADIDNSL